MLDILSSISTWGLHLVKPCHKTFIHRILMNTPNFTKYWSLLTKSFCWGILPIHYKKSNKTKKSTLRLNRDVQTFFNEVLRDMNKVPYIRNNSWHILVNTSYYFGNCVPSKHKEWCTNSLWSKKGLSSLHVDNIVITSWYYISVYTIIFI